MTAREDLAFWEQANPKIIEKINAILESILADPEKGIGKPEKLRYELSGLWSRRINHKDRMVYQIGGDTVIVLQLRDHY
ncbi:MAG: Txe/YoeB family addiction module toxin [Candidatus Nanopelagicaceae bacterium]|nr:Txe/YoeB family addiction module toxin [Candidatus Nanopelagicaceae bacterium]